MFDRIEKCSDYAVITIDKRGVMRQLSAPDFNAARQLARQYEASRLAVVIEDSKGRIVYEKG